MADPTVVATRVMNATHAARVVVDRHASAQRKQGLATNYPSPMGPAPNQDPLLFAAYQSEILAGLAEIVNGLVPAPVAAASSPDDAAAEAEPQRKRGRPRKEDAS